MFNFCMFMTQNSDSLFVIPNPQLLENLMFIQKMSATATRSGLRESEAVCSFSVIKFTKMIMVMVKKTLGTLEQNEMSIKLHK